MATIAGLGVALVAFILGVFLLADAASGEDDAPSAAWGIGALVVSLLAATTGLWVRARQRRR